MKKWKKAVVAANMCFGLAAGATDLAFAQNQPATQRSIKEFVAAQGTFCIPDPSGSGCVVFVPPVANFIGFSNNVADSPPRKSAKRKLCASVDYAGLADAKAKELTNGSLTFGTTTDGAVTERRLLDGRAEVNVRLQTKNALSWVIDGSNDPEQCNGATSFATLPLLFGHRLNDVLLGADAALGDSFMQLVFINPRPGDPLPDLQEIFTFAPNGPELVSLSFYVTANGTLRQAFGVAEGTPGMAKIVQTGVLFRTPFIGKGTADGFPAERIELNVVGR